MIFRIKGIISLTMIKLKQLTKTLLKFPEDIPQDQLFTVHMLYGLIALFALFLPPLLIYSFVVPPPHGKVFQIILFSLTLCMILAIIELRNKNWNNVIYLLIFPAWLGISYGVYFSGGVYVSTTMLYTIPLSLSVVFSKSQNRLFINSYNNALLINLGIHGNQ